MSLRSHAEGFLCGFPEGEGLRPGWDRHYRTNAEVLVRRAGTVMATLGRDPAGPAHSTVPFVADWIALLRRFRDQAVELVRDGSIAFPSIDTDTVDEQGWSSSPFHHRLFSNPRWPQTQRSEEFLLYRLLLNLTYLSLTRIGIPPVERFLLCHLAANTIEDTYGVSAFDLVG